MKKVIVEDDGWDCIPELQDFVNELDTIKYFVYEIENCIRMSNVGDMVYEMRSALKDSLNILDEIDTNIELIQK